MAFRMAGSTETIEVRGGSKIVKVIQYGVYSLPSETYFQFRRDKGSVTKAQINSVAEQLSDRIEAVLGLANVTDVDYFQDTTRGGRLQDRMRTYYATPDGMIEGDVESDLAHFGPTFTRNQINAEIQAARAILG